MAKITVKEHGVSIAVKRTKKDLFIELTVMGKLRHEDYMVFIPIIEKALKEAKGLKVNLLIDMTSFRGWAELKAMLDDAKFGFKHLNDFDRIAAVGDKKWEKLAMKVWGAVTKSKVKFFKKREKALEWLLK